MTPEEQLGRVAEGLAALCEDADQHHMNVLAGCRSRPSRDAGRLLQVIWKAGHSACGALPSFGELAAPQRDEDIAALLKLAKGMTPAAAGGKSRCFRRTPTFVRAGSRAKVAARLRCRDVAAWPRTLQASQRRLAIRETAKAAPQAAQKQLQSIQLLRR